MKISTLLAVTLLLSPVTYAEDACKTFRQLNNDQLHNIRLSINRGANDDLGLTLAAIAMTESTLGKYRVNTRTKDFGLYQINLKTAKSIIGIENEYLGYLLAMKLTFDDELNAKYALNVLRHFHKVHKGNWSKVIMAYNAGNNYKNGERYLTKVKSNLKMIRQCMDFGG